MPGDDLQDRMEQLQRRYRARFAGYDRSTRDLSELSVIVEEVRQVVIEARGLGTDDDTAKLVEMAQSTLALYEREREAVAVARSAPEAQRRASSLGHAANRLFHVYRRHFARQSRKTRDLGLLAEIIGQLRTIDGDMASLTGHPDVDPAGLTGDREVVERNLTMYVRERGEVVAARGMGANDAQADLLAEIANLQFDIYRAHFAGQDRLTRRPGLLRRVIDNLAQVRDRMRDLRTTGVQDETHAKNIRMVSEQMALYREELDTVEMRRESASILEIVDGLGSAIQRISSEYSEHFAGKERATRDLNRLRTILDRTWELERQMVEIEAGSPLDRNHDNLRTARDMLTLYGREYDAIQNARSEKE